VYIKYQIFYVLVSPPEQPGKNKPERHLRTFGYTAASQVFGIFYTLVEFRWSQLTPSTQIWLHKSY